MATIDKRSDGRYRARWREFPGGPQKTRQFDRKADAERFLDEIQAWVKHRSRGGIATVVLSRLLYRYRYTPAVAQETYSRHLIRMARRKAGLSQSELAALAGTSQAAVSTYESGKRSPSVDTLCRLLAAAGYEVRMRLAEPDTHEPALRRAEQLLPSEQVASHQQRERERVSRRAAHA